MKTRNKIFIGSGIIFLFLAIAGYGLVSAYGPWGDFCMGFHPRFHDRRFHSDAHRKDMADFILWRIDKKAKELNLTPAQKAKYEALKGNLKTHFSEAMNDRQKMKDQFLKEMDQENPDVKFMVQSIKTKINEMQGFLNKNLDLLADFYASLDSDQKRMVKEEIRERMKYHRS
jgi:hypothetical protein